ncbi:hypothetical protein N7532_007370 [Penicillium argentinense]|uniref:Rhodopsin domain-containing protein n=1 Tax=Penicillium argentinense TaxID=1131581 RepID=A0A9W9F7L1_9EURO|nr:uncharacterized protein N7532_007370 [Penicillium argentinense]KAJ5095079.1 hypothetical protein N7532_007370 [Penicillium argentinense]
MENQSVEDVLGPLPVGMDLSENRAHKDNAVVITLCVVTVVMVILRFVVRTRGQKPRPELDDWLIAAAVIPLMALLAASILAGHWGMGKHIWATTLQKVVEMKRILFAWIFVYIFELFVIKVSILMFYRRIFGMNSMIWTCLALSTAWVTGSMIALLACPDPIPYFWNQTVDPLGGRFRYNFYNYYIGNAAGNVVSDVFILLVPFPIVWRLKMRVTQKLMVSGVLLLGVFVCAASIIRLHYVHYLNSPDLTWVMSDVYVWSAVEPCLGIICGSLPAMQPLVRSVMKMETLFQIRPQFRRGKPSSAAHVGDTGRLQQCSSNNGSMASKLTPVNSFEAKPEIGLQQYDDETRLTTVVTHIESQRSNGLNRNLEELLGPPGFIRVRHEVELSVA